MADEEEKVERAVGYRNPPAQHRFKKGVSGNPRGRPRKTGRSSKAARVSPTQLEDILLAEAMRPIQLRENDQVIEMPMIQAVIRSMGVAAIKGSHRSQTALASMVQAVEEKRYEDLKSLFASAVEYKDRWQREFEECDRRGVPRPEPVPHPQEIVLDSGTLRVKFNGPESPDEKAHWDMMLDRRREALEEVAYYRAKLSRPSKYKEIYLADMAHEQSLADMIGGIIPDAETRRRPGFDLLEWRERQGVLADLDEKYRRRRARKG
ncbi:MAG: DUF5681 domain-containing protein [Caulobacteraceae bacterium]